MTELKIPDEAYTAGETAYRETWASPDEFILAILDAAAPLIVAAELRRLVDLMINSETQKILLERANKLDPQGLTTYYKE